MILMKQSAKITHEIFLIISGLLSISFGVFLLLHHIDFLFVLIYGAIETIFVLFNLITLKKNREPIKQYKFMQITGIFWVVITVISTLLLALLCLRYNGPEFKYFEVLSSCSILISLKIILAVIEEIMFRKNMDIDLYTSKTINEWSIFFYLHIFLVFLTSIFDGGVKSLPVIIINLVINVIACTMMALYALSLTIIGTEKENLKLIARFKAMIQWFSRKKIFSFVGIFFTYIAAIINLTYLGHNIGYIFIVIFYVFLASIKLGDVIWRIRIEKRNGDNINAIKYYSYKIQLFTSIMIFVLGQTFAAAIISILITYLIKDNSNNLFFFIFIIPFSALKLFSAIRCFVSAKKNKDPFLYTFGVLSLFVSVTALVGNGLFWLRLIDEKIAAILLVIIYIFMMALFGILSIVMFIKAIIGLARKKRLLGEPKKDQIVETEIIENKN